MKKKVTKRVEGTLDALVGRAWAWAIQNDKGRWMLCNWAHPTKQGLDEDGKPSPEARKVWVKMTANAAGQGCEAYPGTRGSGEITK